MTSGIRASIGGITWQVEEEDVEAVDGATTSHNQPLTNKPSWRLLVLQLLLLQGGVLWQSLLHRLVQLWAREG